MEKGASFKRDDETTAPPGRHDLQAFVVLLGVCVLFLAVYMALCEWCRGVEARLIANAAYRAKSGAKSARGRQREREKKTIKKRELRDVAWELKTLMNEKLDEFFGERAFTIRLR